MAPDRAALEAEADRLLGVYIRVKMLAQSQRTDFLAAGAQAVRNGLVVEEDWALVRQVGPPG